MPSNGLLFRTILRKQILLLIRYPVNTASEFLGLLFIFGIIVGGGQAVYGAAINSELSGLIVGFFLFTMAYSAFEEMAWTVTYEAQWGTLEQLIMSPYGIWRIVGTQMVANLLVSGLYGAVMLTIMLGVTGKTVALDLVTVVPIVLLAIATATGLGFIFSGIALLYKRIESLLLLVEFGLLGVIAIPVGLSPLVKLLPIAQGNYMLHRAMNDGVRLWEFPAVELGWLTITAVGYLVAGYLVFQYALNRGRRRGVLGHY